MGDFINNIEAVILANGEYPRHSLPLNILYSAKYVVCCDGGADGYIKRGYLPDVIIGDGDSLSKRNRKRFSDIIINNPDQETNDQTKAVEYLLLKGCKNIAIVGATGKREDHTIGNISLLIEYKRMGLNVRLYTDYGLFIPCSGCHHFKVKENQRLSIFNFTSQNLSATGLKYPIYSFKSWWQGTLNTTTGNELLIEADGEYLLFMAY